jgi:PAS domain S-box-containing protein
MKLFKSLGKDNGDSKKSSRLPANLRDDTLKFKVIVDNIEDGVILVDDQQVIQMINPGAAAICGWPVDEATGVSVQAVIQLANDKGEPYTDADNPFGQIFTVGQSLRTNNAFIMTRDKQLKPVSISLTPLTDGDDKQVTAAVAVLSDDSKQRAEEQQRADFISTASHEMRTPVAAIEGYLALALNEKVATIDSQARGYLDKAHISTQHLGTLFQDLLTSAKAEDGRLTSHPQVVEVGEFLEQLTGDLRLVADKKGLFTDFVLGANSVINATKDRGGERAVRPLYYTHIDPDRFREVITNLFDNAVKYTSEGSVSIGLTGNDKMVQCYVRDTGPGMPADDLPHLFQKFYRLDNSATRTAGGSGLGLFICRKIIELYNGRIWAESKLGEGSSFYINLPRLSTEKANQLLTADKAAGGLVSPEPAT